MQDYIYALLTGYIDPPAGVEIREGMNYNPYFPGGAISMARVLFDGLVEYEDGTNLLFIRTYTLLILFICRYPGHYLPDGQGRCPVPQLGC